MPRGRKASVKKPTPKTTKATEKKTRSLSMSKKAPLQASIQTQTEPTSIVNTTVQTYAELMAALAARSPEITLSNNIIVENNILITGDVKINFNGFSIIAEETLPAARVLDIRSGRVTLAGHGKVFAMGARSVAMRVFGAISVGVPNYTTVTIGKDINLYAPDAYGILISPNLGVAYGLTLNFSGKIMAHDGICVAPGIRGDRSNSPKINLENTASIIADDANGLALEAAGFGKWKIKTADLQGAVGASLRTGILDFRGTRVMAYAGTTFLIEDGDAQNLTIKIDGGTYWSRTMPVFAGFAAPLKTLALKNCELYSIADEAITSEIEACAEINDCEFESDVEGYLEKLASETVAITEAAEAPEPTAATETVESANTTAPIDIVDTEDSVDSLIAEKKEEAPAKSNLPAKNTKTTSAHKNLQTQELEISDHDESENLSDIDKAIMAAFEEESEDDMIDKLFEYTDDDFDLEAAFAQQEQQERQEQEAQKLTITPATSTTKSTASETSAVKSTASATSTTKSTAQATSTSTATNQPVEHYDAYAQAQTQAQNGQASQSETEIAPKSPRRPRKSKTPDAPPVQMPFSQLSELSDADTDEHEIMLSLAEEDPDLRQPSITTLPPLPVDIDELEAARSALFEAVSEIRKLRAEDYDVGFQDLGQAIANAEQILAQPVVELTVIRDAAAHLLQAFDGLEERNEFSLSDAELDDLFYHGAVLEEILRPAKSRTPKNRSVKHQKTINANSDSAVVQAEITKIASGARLPQSVRTPLEAEPDFAMLSDILATISTLNLGNYTAASQTTLLTELDRAQAVLINPDSTQAEIDEVATNLLAQVTHLEPISSRHAKNFISTKTSAPAPIIGRIIPATMIDEMTPNSIWSSGIMMIDEMTPFVTDATTREKMLRAVQPEIKALVSALTTPFRKIKRSFSAGFRAGINAYRETLRAK